MLYPHAVTVVRPAMVSDGKGGLRPDWAAATTSVVQAFVQPRTSDENLDSQNRVTSRRLVVFPPGTDVTATDRVDYAGSRYFVDGDVDPWPRLAGSEHHREAFLRKVAG